MPRKAVSEEPDKVQRLSLAELAAHDDVCSDAMIDNAYFKSVIRKNRGKHIPVRGIREDDIPKILLHKVICDKDPVAAEKAILKLPGIKRYRSGLRSKTEQEHFLSHLRKYIQMYMTDCPWEVSTTNRYTITTYEAAVTARRRIKQGEMIKALTGTMVPLTTEESADLDLTNRNFSIVVSSRKKNSSIFLGPARFANHDCDANGRLVTKGHDGMEVIAMKNIEIGDEITVSYGDDYFGPANVDCLCHTCEVLERNGWTSRAAFAGPQSDSTSPDPDSSPTGRQKKRKYEADTSSQASSSRRSVKRPKPIVSPSKLQQSWTPPSSSDSDVIRVGTLVEAIHPAVSSRRGSHDELTLSPPRSPAVSAARLASDANQLDDKSISTMLDVGGVTRDDRPHSSASIRTKKGHKMDKMTARLLGNIVNRRSMPLSPVSTTPSNQDSAEGNAPEIVNEPSQHTTTVTVKVENVETTKIETDDPQEVERPTSLAAAIEQESESQSTEDDCLATHVSSSAQVISNLSTTKVSTIINPLTESSIVPSIEPTTTTTTIAKMTIHPVSDSIRVPGDYVLTRKLLAQPHDRWVRCHNEKCFGFFVQPNGYQTRRECPRCERHSMLYGFPWPKTDPDLRRLLERKKELGGRGKKGAGAEAISAYRRQGRCGKGTWVEGGGDEEERVMDHRIVHRFVLPEEERELTRKGLLIEAEQLRASGEEGLVTLDGRRSRGAGTESVARETSESGSATPDESRRRSNRFVPNRVYADVY